MRNGTNSKETKAGQAVSEGSPNPERALLCQPPLPIHPFPGRFPFYRGLTLLLLVAITITAFVFLPGKEILARSLERIPDLGIWGPVLWAASYVPACLVCFPGTILGLGAGYAFGVIAGTIAVSLGSVLGASAAFALGRTLARGWVEGALSNHPRFRALDQAVGQEGFKIVLLTRLSPWLPFTWLNYAFGLTPVRFRDFLLASWLGMFPGTVLYVYLGSAVKNLTEISSGNIGGGWLQNVLFFGGLAATVLAAVLIGRKARQILRQAIPGFSHKKEGP